MRRIARPGCVPWRSARCPAGAQDTPAPARRRPAGLQDRDDRVPRHRRPGRRRDWGAQGGSARNIAGDESASGTAQVGHFVEALPSSDWQLTDIENKLRASGAYVPVAHVAWSQTASCLGHARGLPAARAWASSVEGLSGTVFLEHGQFLHLGMTLTYADECARRHRSGPPRARRSPQREPPRALLRAQLLRPSRLRGHHARHPGTGRPPGRALKTGL